MDADVLIVGGGLAGLGCGLILAEQGKRVTVLEARDVLGGRTSSWEENGMLVESGFHKVIGYYKVLPELLSRAGVSLDEIVAWETSMEIRLPDGEGEGKFGIAPGKAPFRTVAGMLGNNDFLPPGAKASLVPFFAAGFRDLDERPDELDRISVAAYARRHEVTKEAVERLLVPLTAGILFLPPEHYSARVFFSIFSPGLSRFAEMKVGAFKGGMTEVMALPLAGAIVRMGGTVRTGAPVRSLLGGEAGIEGVQLEDGSQLRASHTVVAVPVRAAQRLIGEQLGGHDWFAPMLRLETMEDCTFQAELNEPLLPKDRTTFGPGTCLGSFSEQSRTTFRHVPGRISAILTPPGPLRGLPPEEAFARIAGEAARLGLPLDSHTVRWRIVSREADFASVQPGQAALRPSQATPVPGLSLAGDYTDQPMFYTMEGAAISGVRAAEAVLGRCLGSLSMAPGGTAG
ncbi:phytoene desaturase [Paenibacillus sp. J31TS4]|uniref:hydroxysqualene dehydroxylase n=1 Tax=Paenibacillus sp. J31TS4 TaxID=2807195 RepID=UPI001B190D58|nr:FAD-dependent oxidoreductase [Paenibacillus sp. J31TS4]GIP40050.1 phytoene desaturase [Paenibacillus sp. J31TS4]